MVVWAAPREVTPLSCRLHGCCVAGPGEVSRQLRVLANEAVAVVLTCAAGHCWALVASPHWSLRLLVVVGPCGVGKWTHEPRHPPLPVAAMQ
jgi:hypothetical protein